ncbi:DUF1810 domain-containing protein [Pelagibacterium xiamenense]|uniref:DUF1810 domain-containing protein n=1 Tax=Pelagibacterium xiamenense TaxID=2901140 RepID=UPI001E502D0D|nr:DUF1810 domain-containing protein [Pelagibacterium xiamenense]MCD7058602.1 DUF1810 domain-containing protein [Pelagibacterium xiamenense]
MHHFLTAQSPIYSTALAELRDGRKRTHWMWFIFPQIAGLGHSPMSQRFALSGLDEARAYAAHPVLGPRLLECTRAVLGHKDKSAHAIFGAPDDLKFRSAMTLFARAVPEECAFREALEAFFGGEEDPETIRRL